MRRFQMQPWKLYKLLPPCKTSPFLHFLVAKEVKQLQLQDAVVDEEDYRPDLT